MKTVYVIGIGTGNPDHLTLQAVDAIRRADVVFLLDKTGPGREALGEARRRVLARAVPDGGPRVVARTVDAVAPARTAAGGSYHDGVARWRGDRARVVAELIATELAPGEAGAFLVWGDPCLYDGTLGILDRLVAAGSALAVEVVPGITSVQALCAAHRTTLTATGGAATVTTARRLAAAPSDPTAHTDTDTVVMLDGRAAFRGAVPDDTEILWGASLGLPDEVVVAGAVGDRGAEIARILDDRRRRAGWVMDTYLLRRRRGPADPASDG